MSLYALVPVRVRIASNCAQEIDRANNLVQHIIELTALEDVSPRKPTDTITTTEEEP
jgi:hypothetical protein